LAELGRSFFGRGHSEVAAGELGRRRAQAVDPAGDRPGEQQRGADRREGGGRRYGEDLHVGAHVEHDPAGQEYGGQRDGGGEEGEPRELEPHRRQHPEQQRRGEPGGERTGSSDQRELDHGANR